MARRRRRRHTSSNAVFDLLLLGGVVFIGYLVLVFLADHPFVFVAFLVGIMALAAWPVVRLIRKARAAHTYRELLRRANIATIDRMPGVEFEEALRLLFQDLGYKVRLTPVVGDFGADLILDRDGQRTVVQAKRHAGTVGVHAVQEIAAARQHYRADKAMVVTNSIFTPAAARLAQSNGVELWGRDQLVARLAAVGRQTKPVGTGADLVAADDGADGDIDTVIGTIERVAAKQTPRRDMELTEALIRDDEGTKIMVVWFRQPELAQQLHPGDRLGLAGRLQRSRFGLEMRNPHYELLPSLRPRHSTDADVSAWPPPPS